MLMSVAAPIINHRSSLFTRLTALMTTAAFSASSAPHGEIATAAATNTNTNDNTGQHYFAIGAMMNPVSVKNRDLDLELNHPAQPGVLLDHKLCFFGLQGFAEVIYEKGSTVHGVVYQCVRDDIMAELDLIERDYIRKSVKVQMYSPQHENQQQQQATEPSTVILNNVSVYCRPQADIEGSKEMDRPPSERYLQLLISGARHFGVDPKYIQWLEDHECKPRCDPSEYLSFHPAQGELRNVKRDAVDTMGNDVDSNKLYVRCGRKVVELCKESEDDSFFEEWKQIFCQREKDIELFMSRVQYDPLFGIPSCIDEMNPEWRAYTEHLFCEYMKGVHVLQRWRVVAHIVD